MPNKIDIPTDMAPDNLIIPTFEKLRIAWEKEDYDEYYVLLLEFGTILEFLYKKGEKIVAGKLAVYHARLDELGNEFDTHQSINQELFIRHFLSPYNMNSLFVGSNIDGVINKYHDELVSLSRIPDDFNKPPFALIIAQAEGRFVENPGAEGVKNIKH